MPVPQIQEEIVEMFQFPPQERTSERTVEQIIDVSVPVPQIQEQISGSRGDHSPVSTTDLGRARRGGEGWFRSPSCTSGPNSREDL